MARKFGAVLAGLVVMALCVAVDAGEDKAAPTKTVMKTLFAKDTGLCGKCAAAGKGEKWEDAQKLAKSLSDCAANLPKNKCPKGDADSWAKQTKEFAELADAVSKAAESKDKDKFAAAIKAFTGTCKACHDAHKK
jgi:hypothetical protein